MATEHSIATSPVLMSHRSVPGGRSLHRKHSAAVEGWLCIYFVVAFAGRSAQPVDCASLDVAQKKARDPLVVFLITCAGVVSMHKVLVQAEAMPFPWC